MLANDFDADGDALTVTNLDTTGMLGTLVLNPVDGSFTYDPRGVFDSLEAGEHVTETFTYTANDGFGNSNTITATLTVIGVNDAPIAANSSVSTNEDTTYTFSASDFNFSDIDGDTLASVQITSLETVGNLQLSGVDVTLNQIISRADIDAGNLKFIPVPEQNGVGYDSFEFKVSDTPATGTVLELFAAPVVNSMSGLAFDGTNLWLAGQSTDHDLSGSIPPATCCPASPAPGTNPTGLTFDGTNLWLVDRDLNTIYELDHRRELCSQLRDPGHRLPRSDLGRHEPLADRGDRFADLRAHDDRVGRLERGLAQRLPAQHHLGRDQPLAHGPE